MTGKFPSAWKHDTVTHIFESGDRNDVNNFRPISLLPILSKVMEKIVAQQLTTFLHRKASCQKVNTVSDLRCLQKLP